MRNEEQPTKLKISKKRAKDLKEKLTKAWVKREGKMEAALKIWWSFIRSKTAKRAMIKFWEMYRIDYWTDARQHGI